MKKNSFRTVVQNAIEQSAQKQQGVKLKAENNMLLVDNYSLYKDQLTVHFDKRLIQDKYPQAIDGYVDEKRGIITWDVAPHWTGTGFKFQPIIKSLSISVTASVDMGEEVGYEDVEINFPVDMDKIEIEIEDGEQEGSYIELKEVTADGSTGEITITFTK